jgi:hypothetical protein
VRLNYALANAGVYIGVVGPSWRQTKLAIRRIGDFARRLPPGSKIVIQKTRVTCPNGSVIEAFPNNPDTIRGPTLHVVYADEFNFIPNAENLYDVALFTLGTTNGKFICTSTPWLTFGFDILFLALAHRGRISIRNIHLTRRISLKQNLLRRAR